MSDIAEKFMRAFIPLFVAIDPVGLVAIFLALSQGASPESRRHIARQAAWTAGAVSLLFLFLGQTIFTALGITVNDFEVAGGLLLFALAAREVLQRSVPAPQAISEDFGVVPLGMPLIAGPATITTLLLIAQTVGVMVALVALAANLVLVVLAFAFSERLGQLIGATGLRALSKIIALLLAAIAVNLIRRGITG